MTPDSNCDDLTPISWRAYVDLRFMEKEKRWNQQIEADTIARDKAEKSIERRLEDMNELRRQLDRQTLTFATVERVESLGAQHSNFVTREAYDLAHALLVGELEDIKAWRREESAARAERDRIQRSTRWLVGVLIALVPIANIVVIWLIETTHSG